MSLISPMAYFCHHHHDAPVRITLINGVLLSDVGTIYRYKVSRLSAALWLIEAVARRGGNVMSTSILRDDQVALVETFPKLSIYEEEHVDPIQA